MQSGKWGSKAYIESLHRTYNIPLPRRDDGAFERALQFRAEEKDFYGRLQQENDQLRYRVGKLEHTLSALDKHSSTLLEYYNDSQTSSKENANGSYKPTVGSTRGSDSDAKRSGDAGASGGKGGGERCADGVSGEVLRPDVPDPSGQSEGHTGDGSEPGQRNAHRGGEADAK
jgi:hypothetical protein